MANVNDSYFDGEYKEIWRSYIPAELTEKETAYMIQQFQLGTDSHVLDIMCGYGRHALALGRKGVTVAAVDNLEEYISEIKEIVKAESLPVTATRSGVLDYQPSQQFDLAICMGNSLNFFPATETQEILKKLSHALKPGGHLFINSWSIAEITMRNFSRQSWERVGELKILHEASFLFYPTRVETETIIVLPDGREEHKTAIDYIFSLNEIESMLNAAGMDLVAAYSIPGKKKFAMGDARVYIEAKKK